MMVSQSNHFVLRASDFGFLTEETGFSVKH